MGDLRSSSESGLVSASLDQEVQMLFAEDTHQFADRLQQAATPKKLGCLISDFQQSCQIMGQADLAQAGSSALSQAHSSNAITQALIDSINGYLETIWHALPERLPDARSQFAGPAPQLNNSAIMRPTRRWWQFWSS